MSSLEKIPLIQIQRVSILYPNDFSSPMPLVFVDIKNKQSIYDREYLEFTIW